MHLRLSSVFALVATGAVVIACADGSAESPAVGDRTSALTAPVDSAPASVPDPSEPSSCPSGGGGFPNGTCVADTTILTQVQHQCAAEGRRITAFEPNESCGVGSSSAFTYACCGWLGTPPPADCWFGSLTVEGACTSDAELERMAAARCERGGAKLTSSTPSHDCGRDSGHSIVFQCCPPQSARKTP